MKRRAASAAPAHGLRGRRGRRGRLVFLIEKFYDPEARAREKAIAAQVALMAEQQKVTDDLTRIEIEIENAIIKNDLDTARARTRAAGRESARPSAPRIPADVDRPPHSPNSHARQSGADQTPAQAAVLPAAAARAPAKRRREHNAKRTAERSADRATCTLRNAASPPRPRERIAGRRRRGPTARPSASSRASPLSAGCADQFAAGDHHPPH